MKKNPASVTRFPAIKVDPSDLRNKKEIERYWKAKLGYSYSFALIMRKLIEREALEIIERGVSLITMD